LKDLRTEQDTTISTELKYEELCTAHKEATAKLDFWKDKSDGFRDQFRNLDKENKKLNFSYVSLLKVHRLFTED
jgi:hypothetical protein